MRAHWEGNTGCPERETGARNIFISCDTFALLRTPRGISVLWEHADFKVLKGRHGRQLGGTLVSRGGRMTLHRGAREVAEGWEDTPLL